MLVLLPPSKGKAPDPPRAPLWDPAQLSFPQLAELRAELLAAEPDRDPGALPALLRYSGVLYDALDARTLRRGADHALVAGRLFGLVRGSDPLPRTLASEDPPPGTNPAARWRPLLTPLLAELVADHLLVDLRSATVKSFGRLPASGVVVEPAYAPPGVPAADARAAPSHTGKHLRGLVARWLLAAAPTRRGEALTPDGRGRARLATLLARHAAAAGLELAADDRRLRVVTRTTVAAQIGQPVG
ncbi:MAG: hypothetical protein JWM48_961 [Mycobacterium sp.]|nr:hypothetical protein [Mycobacterium sp.]